MLLLPSRYPLRLHLLLFSFRLPLKVRVRPGFFHATTHQIPLPRLENSKLVYDWKEVTLRIEQPFYLDGMPLQHFLDPSFWWVIGEEISDP